MTDDKPQNQKDISRDTIVVTTEDGIVLTGSKAEAFEARIFQSVRKLYLTFAMLMVVLFIILIGVVAFLNKLSTTVDNTDRIVTDVGSPSARAQSQQQQQKVIADLLAGMDCRNQKNLQRFVIALANSGDPSFKNLTIPVDPNCLKP